MLKVFWSFHVNALLSFIGCAAWDRSDYERPGRHWEGAVAVPGYSPPSPATSQLQTALRKQRPQDDSFDRQQRPSWSGGGISLQEMWQVSDQKCGISHRCCVGEAGVSLFAYIKMTAALIRVA